MEVAEEIEEVVDFLLTYLKDRETIVRWSAAKGLGRVTARLPWQFADQVVGSVLESFSSFEGDGAWHGGCLTLAELGRRGLLLPKRLGEVVPVVVQALIYEDRRGNYALGAHVRNAACYVCWSFARAYAPEVIRPYVRTIAGALLVTTVYDREVNCRRAASAAFQENVGRQGEFPHGIEIVVEADYSAVGNRTHAFVHLGRFIAQYPDYTLTLIDHLLTAKVAHWDPAIRQLTASALAALAPEAPDYLTSTALPKLVAMATDKDMETRHGAILATGEVVLALKNHQNERRKETDQPGPPWNLISIISVATWRQILAIVPTLQQKNLLLGLAGEWTKKALCRMIHTLAEAELPLSDVAWGHDPDAEPRMEKDVASPSSNLAVRDSWLSVINELLHHADPAVTALSVAALPHFCTAYFHPQTPEFEASRAAIIHHYRDLVINGSQEKDRQGHCLALAALPRFMYAGSETATHYGTKPGHFET